MINETKTFELFGYTSDKWKSGSHKLIVVVCDICKKCYIVEKREYHNNCRSCNSKHPNKLPKPKFIKKEDRFILGTQIDRILTIEKFNYDPADLKDNSRKKVITVCEKCYKIREVRRAQCSNLCRSCSKIGKYDGENNPMYGRDRSGKNHPNYGKHHSETTKEKNRQSHLGKITSDKTKQKLSKILIGRCVSNETKQKMKKPKPDLNIGIGKAE